MSAVIKAVEYYFPSRSLDNAEIAATCQVDAAMLRKTSGVERRYVVAEGEAPSDMAVEAAKKLFATGILEPEGIDALVFCTEIPDCRSPVTAALLHGRLGFNSNSVALDLPGGCSGFVHALVVAKGLIATSQAAHVLILTAEACSLAIPPHDHVLLSIFGDGAAATLVSGDASSGIGTFVMGTDSSGAASLGIAECGARLPRSAMPFGTLRMDGQDVLRFTLRRVPELIDSILSRNYVQKEDIDLYILHQASGFVLAALQKKCAIPEEKFFVCLEDGGNTVSSTLPIALARARAQNRLLPGMRVLLAGFGVGFSWAGTILDWQD